MKSKIETLFDKLQQRGVDCVFIRPDNYIKSKNFIVSETQSGMLIVTEFEVDLNYIESRICKIEKEKV